ncbi:Flp pilus assembly protein CpaB [Arthrobacter sp. Sa2BUA2]|uniref:Flp pilus assembly protein CpaB n=1 Tax=Arthrobacter pullicola TaxID=2762224 RepID=A0ABR8YIN6_9MICC|nr:Flp pilus assembly protein CpaB [Arthrobacter pullicola]MBD8044069.1 Flp pilus assembly protein CpaB [Arthrobacter pullicola]
MFGHSNPRRAGRGPAPGTRVSPAARPAPRSQYAGAGTVFRQPGRERSGRAALRDRLRRFTVRRRRLLAGILASLACGIAVEACLPPDARTVDVVTARADLPAGHVLTPGDLRVAALPAAGDSPGSFADTGAVTGKRLAVPLRAGSVLTDSFFVGPGLLAGMPAGTSAVPLRTADPAAAGLLSPGVLVDVMLAPDPGSSGAAEASLLAAGVPVLWIAGEMAEGGGTWPGAAKADAGLVVVAAGGRDAAALAGASERGNLYLVLSGE